MYKTLRRVRIALSLAFLVVLTLPMVDILAANTHFGTWLMEVQLVPAILAGAAIWIVLWVVVTILVGRVYCSTVCPLGTVQDISASCSRAAGAARSRRRGTPPPHYRYAPAIDSLRVPVPVIVAVCLIAGVMAVVDATDPFTRYSDIVRSIVHPLAIGVGALAVNLLVLAGVCALAAARGRLLCNTICPVGGFLGLLSRQALYAPDINTDKCTHCGLCEDVCKAQCINLKDCVVDTSRCVMCLDCTAVCPNDAIIVRRGRHRLQIPMMMKTSGTSMSTQSPGHCQSHSNNQSQQR